MTAVATDANLVLKEGYTTVPPSVDCSCWDDLNSCVTSIPQPSYYSAFFENLCESSGRLVSSMSVSHSSLVYLHLNL